MIQRVFTHRVAGMSLAERIGMRNRVLVLSAGLLLTGALLASGAPPNQSIVDVYKSATCGCCAKWIDHMRRSGFTVRTLDLPDDQLAAFKASHGVTTQVQSCHTALVGGYVVEGHVPSGDVRRLLAEKPQIVGLAAPGMPRGAPGMEVWGQPPQPYSVVAFDRRGKLSEFASH